MRKSAIIFVIVCALIAAGGIYQRSRQQHRLEEATKQGEITTVSVIAPKPPQAEDEIVLPGRVEAWHDAPIYARTNGYIANWYTDIGAHVKAGDALADIDTPDVDAQLRQAEADLQTADANNALAQSTAKRWLALRKTDSVTQQETDEKTADAAAKAAAAASARANRDRLAQLESFKHVVAPFDGVISARNVDKGDLIDAGASGGQMKELFHIVDKAKLRIYVQVPEIYTQRLSPGMEAELHFAEHPGKVYKAALSAHAGALDAASRTLQTEWEADNANEELLPGGFTETHIKVPGKGDGLRLPVNTLLFRPDGVNVAVVDDGHARLKIIKLGRDFGNEVEVAAGLAAEDKVVVNPPDSLADGQPIRIAAAAPEKKEPGKEPAKDQQK